MQLNQKPFTAQCINKNFAIALCVKSGCSQSPLICANDQCQCRQTHSDCLHSAFLSQLRKKFQYKNKCTKLLLSSVYDWYENQAKLIAIEMEHLKTIIDGCEWKLQGDEEKLYHYLVDGKSELIVSELITKVMDKMLDKDANQMLTNTEVIKKQLAKSQKQLKTAIEQIKITMNSKIKNFYASESLSMKTLKFSQTLHATNIHLVDGNTIKMKDYTGNYWTSILQPSLFDFDFQTFKVKFQINQATESYLMFGVCQIGNQFDISKASIHNSVQIGSFTGRQKSVFVGPKDTKRSSNIALYETNDQVEVEYKKEDQKVTVRNLTKGTRSVSYIKTDPKRPLYFGVMMIKMNDEVSITDSSYN